MKMVSSVADVKALVGRSGRSGRLGLVPTMGALHAGHVALFEAARAECRVVVASVFVNPSQFGDARDLAAYPCTLDADARIAEHAGVDVLFAPSVDAMYPGGFATWIEPAGAADGLEAAHRPGHFRGVATVVAKLLGIVGPDLAFFGQKDAQQVAVIAQMVRDLNIDVVLRVVPTVRDIDGLALSSRNARLAEDERVRARAVPRAIGAGLAAHRTGGDPVHAAREALRGVDVDYVAVADWGTGPTLAVAVRVGSTRLIDNAPLVAEPSAGGRL